MNHAALVGVLQPFRSLLDRVAGMVDGQPAVSWRANFAYKAVHLDPGQHTVEWRFGDGDIRPTILGLYQLLSTILIIMLVLLAAKLGGVPDRSSFFSKAKAPVFGKAKAPA